MLFAQTSGWVSTGTNLHINSFTTNVGIGTAAPACRLEVWKSSYDVNYPNIPCLGLFNDNSSGLSKSEIVFGNAFTNLTSTTVNPHWAMGIDFSQVPLPYKTGVAIGGVITIPLKNS